MATNNAVNTTLFGQTGTGEFVGAEDAEMTNLTIDNINISGNTISTIVGNLAFNPFAGSIATVQIDRNATSSSFAINNINTTDSNSVTRLTLTSAATTNADTFISFNSNNNTSTQWSEGNGMSTLSGSYFIGRGTYATAITTGLAVQIDASLNTTLYGQLNVGDYNINGGTISTLSGAVNIAPFAGELATITVDRNTTGAGLQLININTASSDSFATLSLQTAATSNGMARVRFRANDDTVGQWNVGQDPDALSNSFFIGRGAAADAVTTGLAMTIDTSLNATFTGQVNVPLVPTATTSATSKAYVDARASTKATIAGTSQAAAVNTTYIALNAGQTTLTLPSTFAVGDEIALIGATANTGGWIIQASGGTTVRVNNATTSAGGTVTSAAVAGQTIYLMCGVANTSWVMTGTVSTTLTTA